MKLFLLFQCECGANQREQGLGTLVNELSNLGFMWEFGCMEELWYSSSVFCP